MSLTPPMPPTRTVAPTRVARTAGVVSLRSCAYPQGFGTGHTPNGLSCAAPRLPMFGEFCSSNTWAVVLSRTASAAVARAYDARSNGGCIAHGMRPIRFGAFAQSGGLSTVTMKPKRPAYCGRCTLAAKPSTLFQLYCDAPAGSFVGSFGWKFCHGIVERIQWTPRFLRSSSPAERCASSRKNPDPALIPKLLFRSLYTGAFAAGASAPAIATPSTLPAVNTASTTYAARRLCRLFHCVYVMISPSTCTFS